VSHSPTPEQRDAIEHLNGPMLVVAGAGSGKTTALARRIANLIQKHNVAPEEILAVTYTDNAAKNLRQRVQQYLGEGLDTSGLQARTFHSYCADLLNRYGRAFKVVEKIDLQVYLNLHVGDLPLKHFIKAASPGQFIGDLLEFNTRCQDDLISSEDYQKYVAGLEADDKLPLPRVAPAQAMHEMPREEVLARCKEIAAVYSYVNKLLREKNWGTFGEMIVDAVTLLRDRTILEKERQRTRFILIDEFQDSNFGQIELAQLLAGETKNIFAVGDPDQAIYRFRGATSEAFEEFKRRFPEARTLTLQHNFRSVPSVLKTAFEVISKNYSPERKPLISGRAELAKASGKKLPEFSPQVIVAPDFVTEAKAVVDSIKAFREKTGAKWSEIAVLYRQHGHREELVTECVERGVPHAVKGVNVLGAPDVRDLIALIRVMAIPDDSVSWFRAAALPMFQIDAAALKFALSSAKRSSSLQTILLDVPGGKKLLDCFARSRQQMMSMKLVARPAIDLLVKNFALPDSPQLKAFTSFVKDWQEKPIVESKSLDEFCEYLNCFIELNGKICLPDKPDQDAVQLMTVHGAKGLEFAHVSVIRANQGAFPTNNHEALFEFPQELSRSKVRALPSGKEMHEQEERRLFYVAITRAEDSLSIYGKPRGKSGPSGYLKELLASKQLSSILSSRTLDAMRIDVQASAAPVTQVGAWLTMPSPALRSQLTLSASAIESYDTCPLKYKIEREWKLPGELSASQQFGSAIHSVLRDYYEAVKAGKLLALETVLEIFRSAIRDAKIQDPLQLQLYAEQGIRQLTAFVESRANEPQPIVLATEKAFDFELGGIRLKGRIDRMDQLSKDEVAIVDYKAGSARTEKQADESTQLTVYALAARHEGKTAERLSFYSLDNNSTVFTERSEEELVHAEEKIADIAEGIRRGDFDPKEGFHCSWCAYSSICPAKEEKLFQISKAAASIQ
jgi:DNA helicase-2/ATP-dependent DNA helicase PcrA